VSGQIQTSFGLILSFSSVRVLNDGKIFWVLLSTGYVKSSSTHDKLHIKQSNTCSCKKTKKDKNRRRSTYGREVENP